MDALETILTTWRKRPFQWGTYDCAHFALDILTAVSKRDWHTVELPLYHNAFTAKRQLKRMGFAALHECVTALLGAPIQPTFAQRGDLVLLSSALGVCTGAHIAATGEQGLVFCPLSAATHCWRV